LLIRVGAVRLSKTMADQPNSESKKRRVVKNPETFRERAVKANQEQPQSKAIKRSRLIVSKPFRVAYRSVGIGYDKLLSQPGFKYLRKPLHILGRIVWPNYFRNSFKELKLVEWPGWKQSRRLTYAVLSFAFVFGTVIAGVDWGLSKIFKSILLK
jgi:preprotein translocase SecE subunit